jgi:fumarate reductase subunit D
LWVVPVVWALFSAMTLWSLHAFEAWVVLAGLALSLGLAAKRRKEHKN